MDIVELVLVCHPLQLFYCYQRLQTEVLTLNSHFQEENILKVPFIIILGLIRQGLFSIYFEHSICSIHVGIIVVNVGKFIYLQFIFRNDAEYVRLEQFYLLRRHRVRLGYDRYQINPIVQFPHDLNVQLLKP
jgi:hypothetical protein